MMNAQTFKFRRGVFGYAVILALLARNPATVRELATAAGMRLPANMRTAVHELHAAKLIHVGAWKSANACGGAPSAVWALGAADDAPPSLRGAKLPKRVLRLRVEMLTFVEAVRCLQAGPSTTADIAEASGMDRRLAQRLVKHMHELGVIRRSAWERSGLTLAPAYRFGRGKDAPRPAREAKRVLDARMWAKKKTRMEQLSVLRALAGNEPIFNLARSA